METDYLDMVLLIVDMENETGKNYISLDRPDYTAYPDEQELILQAGIICKVVSVSTEKQMSDTITVFRLKTSEKMVRRHELI